MLPLQVQVQGSAPQLNPVSAPTEVKYDALASVFSISGDIGDYIKTAKGIVADLRNNASSDLQEYKLPHDLNLFHISCLAGDKEFLERLIADSSLCESINDKNASIGAEDQYVQVGSNKMPAMNGDTPLHFALFMGFEEGAECLIKELGDKLEHTVNNTGNSVLNLAARKCSHEIVKMLCTRFSSDDEYQSYLLHKTDNQSSLLHHAAQQEDPTVLKYLRKQQATFSKSTFYDQDKGGKTPRDYIKGKVGERYVQRLDTDEAFRDSLWSKGFDNSWQKYYVEDCLGDTRSWIPPWQRCLIV